jgi:hypothetical protein
MKNILSGFGLDLKEIGKKADLETDQKKAMADVARAIVGRGLTVPAIMFLESAKPLSFVGGQFLNFMDPIVNTFFNVPGFTTLASALEERENVELLIGMIEQESKRVEGTAAVQDSEKAPKTEN